jgi:oxygen-dependent protoporphyrinogen oxidase
MRKHKIIILGAGVSGLCCAHWLGEKSDYIILEKDNRVGGRIRSERHDKVLVEHGPNMIMLRSAVVKDLLLELGLDKRLIYSSRDSKKRFICNDGELIQVTPFSVFTRLTDMRARLQLMLGGISRAGNNINETVYDFFARKISPVFVDNLIVPLMSGVFAGDPADLIMRSAFPKIFSWDKTYNSLVLGALKTQRVRHKIPSGMCSFPDGLQEIPDLLAKRLKERLVLNTGVNQVKRTDSGFSLQTESESYECEKLVVTIPAPDFAAVLNGEDELKSLLEPVYYPWMTVCHFVYNAKDVGEKRCGFGFLNTHYKKIDTLGCLFSSHMFSDRTGDGEELYTVFCGGAKGRHTREFSREELAERAHAEVAKAMKITAKAPKRSFFAEWPLSIPQYNREHLPLLEKISAGECERRGIYFSSNYAYGISVSDCIERAKVIAGKLGADSASG